MKLLQKLFSKRTLYILCFMALSLIEFLRATQRGNVWHAAVNCMGLVIMVIVFSAYPLKDFCTVINYIYTGFCAVAMIAVYFHWQQHVGEYLLGQVETAILNIWWLGIFLRYLFRRVVIEKTITFKPNVLGWLGIIISVLMICSVSGRLWPLWYFLMFGSFYVTKFTKEDRKALFDGMINGTILSFFCLQIYAYGFRPYDEVRYKGALSNCNMTALYYLVVYAMVLFKLHILECEKAHKGWKLFYLIGAGGLLSFQFMTMGRTAWVSAIAVTIFYGIMVIRKLWQKKWHQVLGRGVALILAMVITFPVVFCTARWLPTILHHPIWYEGEYSINKVHPFDAADSWKYVEMDEFLEEVFGRILKTFAKIEKKNPLILYANATEMEMERVEYIQVPWTTDEALVGRISIYKAYWDKLTFIGHGENEGYFLLGDSGYYSWHAQNLYLQIAYFYGVPAGILLIVISAFMLYYYSKKMKQGKENVYAIIPFLFCIVYFVFGLMEVVWNPGQLVMFLFFFVQHPQMIRES